MLSEMDSEVMRNILIHATNTQYPHSMVSQ